MKIVNWRFAVNVRPINFKAPIFTNDFQSFFRNPQTVDKIPSPVRRNIFKQLISNELPDSPRCSRDMKSSKKSSENLIKSDNTVTEYKFQNLSIPALYRNTHHLLSSTSTSSMS